jgi:RNA polymerase subunit RPABC4/transcription elongation factor Spt4
MPQCPHCQAVYAEGQRYCPICGSFLRQPEDGDTSCPQCGARLSPRQEFCRECGAPLKAETPRAGKAPAEAPPAEPPADPALGSLLSGVPTWVNVTKAMAITIAILLFLVALLTRQSGPPAAPSVPTSQAPASAPPNAPEAVLQGELLQTLSTVRDAQLKKNITEFMNAYSNTFPGYDQKRRDTLKSWQKYDYLNLVFTVDKVQAINADNAKAWVTSNMDLRNRNTQELSSLTRGFQVWFVKEKGRWRISKLKVVLPQNRFNNQIF